MASPASPNKSAPACRRRYHSTQLAIITAIFAGGGLICSLLLLDGDEEIPRPHHWLRQSYSSPMIVSPQGPAAAPSAPQNPPIRSSAVRSSPRYIRDQLSAKRARSRRSGESGVLANPPIRSTNDDKSALQPRRISARKSASHPGRIGRTTRGFRPLIALRAKWTKFTANLRRYTMPFNFSRNLAFGSGSKSCQRRFEEG